MASTARPLTLHLPGRLSRWRVSPAWVSVIGVLLLWELITQAGILSQRSFPTMSATFAELFDLVQEGAFWSSVGETLKGWALGLGVAAGLAVPLGVVIGSNGLLYRPVRPIIEFLRPIPSVALIPLVVLAYGTGLKSEVFLAAFAAFWPLLIQTLYGVQNVDPVATDTGRSFGLGRLERFYRIKLPSAAPYVVTGVRIASTVSLVLAVTAELVIGSPGLGQSINLARSGGALEVMYALIIVTGLLGWGLNIVFTELERRLLHWHPSYRAGNRRGGRLRRLWTLLGARLPDVGPLVGRLRGALPRGTVSRPRVRLSARARQVIGLSLEVTVPIAALGLWAAWSSGSGSLYFPPLADILDTFEKTWLFERWGSDVLPSLERLGAGYAIAVVVGVTVGIPLGLSRTAGRAASPIVEFLRAIPPPALLPLAIVLFGVGGGMKIFIIALGSLFPVLLNTIDGVRGINSTLVETSRIYGVRGIDRLRRVVLPAASPQIFAGMRISLSLALILMVISEMVASTNGLGFFVLQAQRSFSITELWSGMVLIGLLGVLLNAMLTLVERRALTWHRGAFASGLG